MVPEQAAPTDVGLSVVIPVYNEVESLRPLYDQLAPVLATLPFASEVVFVDDGSTDGSFAVVEALHQADPRIRGVRFRRNYRKAAALSAGFREARGRIVITMDADLQDDPQEIPHLLAALEPDHDLISGWKRRRHDPLSKTLPSKVWNRVTSAVAGIRLHDFNCGLKAYRREVTQDVLPYLYGELYRYLPAMAHWLGYRVGEVVVLHHPRRYGYSKFGARRLLSGFLDLLSITFVMRFMTRPMHVFGALGVVAAGIGSVIALYIASLRLRFGDIQNRHPLLMLAVLLLVVGVQFISTGLIGDMLASANQQGGHVPPVERRVGAPRD